MAGSANYEDLRSEFTLFSHSARPINNPPLDISTALFIVTLFVTLYRCYSRYRKKLWWHDDSAALFSTLFFVFFLVGSYLCFRFVAPDPGTNNFSSVIPGSTYIAGGMALPLGYQ